VCHCSRWVEGKSQRHARRKELISTPPNNLPGHKERGGGEHSKRWAQNGTIPQFLPVVP